MSRRKLNEKQIAAIEEKRKEFEKKRSYIDEQLPKECGNCGETSDLQIHHVVPLSYGGSNRLSNLVRLCTDCHAKAHGGLSFVSKSEESRNKRASVGRNSSSTPPIGYKTVNGRIEIDEETEWIVRFIFRMRFKHEYSTTHIADALTYMAIPTVRGAKKWTHPAVKRILDNPRYLGHNRYKGVIYEDTIPPIIDEQLAEIKRNFEIKYEGKRLSPRVSPVPA